MKRIRKAIEEDRFEEFRRENVSLHKTLIVQKL